MKLLLALALVSGGQGSLDYDTMVPDDVVVIDIQPVVPQYQPDFEGMVPNQPVLTYSESWDPPPTPPATTTSSTSCSSGSCSTSMSSGYSRGPVRRFAARRPVRGFFGRLFGRRRR